MEGIAEAVPSISFVLMIEWGNSIGCNASIINIEENRGEIKQVNYRKGIAGLYLNKNKKVF